MNERTDTKLASRDPQLRGLRVLVVGLGRSGLAAVRLAVSRGAIVRAADARTESEVGDAAAKVRRAGAEVCTGGHPPALAGEADLIVLSPGVPPSTAVVTEARRLGVPVWSEVELAFRFCRGRIVAVTGTNGKSTTTSMAGAILRAAGVPGGTGGNLGTPFCDLLAEDGPDAVHALELSSFQLETIETFRAEVGIVLNVNPDHMDRYSGFAEYVRAKARLLETQRSEDFTVLNADDAESLGLGASAHGRVHLFSTRHEVDRGACVRDGLLILRTGAEEERLMEARELPVPGEQNLANALAAALACRLANCEPGTIARALRSYRALPHRLQFVASVDGVDFYNDSKATNLDAAARALESFPPGRVHLILGGRDKGADWSSLAPLARTHARRILLVGEAAPKVRAGLENTVPVVDCATVRTAVRAGFEGAAPGDVVLLAPGCASFDQYRDFEDRGEDFQRAVESLLPEGEHRA